MMFLPLPRSAVRHYRFSLLFFFVFMLEVVLWSTPDVCGDRYPNLDSYLTRHNDLYHLLDKDLHTFRHASPSSVFSPALSSSYIAPDKIMANEFKNMKTIQMRLMELGDGVGSSVTDSDSVLPGVFVSPASSCSSSATLLLADSSDNDVRH